MEQPAAVAPVKKTSANFSFSNKFAKKPDAATGENSGDADQKKKRGAKTNVLLNAKTDPHVDDTDLYKPRLTREDRLTYFNFLLENRRRRTVPVGFTSWTSQEIAHDNELENYPFCYRVFMYFVRSNRWDQWYLNFFIIMIVLAIFFIDGWAKQFVPFIDELNAGNALLALPALGMIITQVIPLIGTYFFIHMANDLVHYMGSIDLANWVSCIHKKLSHLEG